MPGTSSRRSRREPAEPCRTLARHRPRPCPRRVAVLVTLALAGGGFVGAPLSVDVSPGASPSRHRRRGPGPSRVSPGQPGSRRRLGRGQVAHRVQPAGLAARLDRRHRQGCRARLPGERRGRLTAPGHRPWLVDVAARGGPRPRRRVLLDGAFHVRPTAPRSGSPRSRAATAPPAADRRAARPAGRPRRLSAQHRRRVTPHPGRHRQQGGRAALTPRTSKAPAELRGPSWGEVPWVSRRSRHRRRPRCWSPRRRGLDHGRRDDGDDAAHHPRLSWTSRDRWSPPRRPGRPRRPRCR